MKNNFQQPAQVELDEQELEQITGGCDSHKHHRHLPPPPPPPHHKHPGQPPMPYPGKPGFPNGFGGHSGNC